MLAGEPAQQAVEFGLVKLCGVTALGANREDGVSVGVAMLMGAQRIGIHALDPVNGACCNEAFECPVDLKRCAKSIVAEQAQDLVGS
ncbi:hypothetical protein A33O_03950 [Nitratireductor aquibiodomus RA22]|uniref:Uncharacterized protein n=1 Tax=Nitratireductor aquibiodomus RA22 TaxID=1189611 RepID=I5C589_9HYPH|nr:hypothetical protein A33O_03950 [Nitratireductor aquibiodomus RA22]